MNRTTKRTRELVNRFVYKNLPAAEKALEKLWETEPREALTAYLRLIEHVSPKMARVDPSTVAPPDTGMSAAAIEREARSRGPISADEAAKAYQAMLSGRTDPETLIKGRRLALHAEIGVTPIPPRTWETPQHSALAQAGTPIGDGPERYLTAAEVRHAPEPVPAVLRHEDVKVTRSAQEATKQPSEAKPANRTAVAPTQSDKPVKERKARLPKLEERGKVPVVTLGLGPASGVWIANRY